MPPRDLADYYQEHPFPGQRMISWSIALWLLVLLVWAFIPTDENSYNSVQAVKFLVLLPIAVMYFVGFWRAVAGKGYPWWLFLFAIHPLLGVLVLWYLQPRRMKDDWH